MATSYKVTGMSCGGCAKSVEKAIIALAPAATVEIDLAQAKVSVDGADAQLVAKAVEEAGFDFCGEFA